MKVPKNLTQDNKKSEKRIQRNVIRYAEIEWGWVRFKFKTDLNKGLPDDIFFKRFKCFAVTACVEFKSKGEKLTALQERKIRLLHAAGVICYVCDSIEEGKRFFKTLSTQCYAAKKIRTTRLSESHCSVYKVES